MVQSATAHTLPLDQPASDVALSGDDKLRFQACGFLVLRQLYTPTEVARIEAAFDGVMGWVAEKTARAAAANPRGPAVSWNTPPTSVVPFIEADPDIRELCF